MTRFEVFTYHPQERTADGVVRLDRLERSPVELVTSIERLHARGIASRRLKEKIDTMSPDGERIGHGLGSIAHFERQLIFDRITDEIATACANEAQPGLLPLT
jgi:DNA invertase Pin-like site-specific DNA recombinase